jgi:hypothetical protein
MRAGGQAPEFGHPVGDPFDPSNDELLGVLRWPSGPYALLARR